jgi:WD40 repeat protein
MLFFEGMVFALKFDDFGHFLLSVGDDRTLRIWTSAVGRQTAEVRGHGARIVNSFVFLIFTKNANF